MFKQGDEVTYINDQVANHIVIEMVTNGIARSTSGQFADLGPFSMTFDVKTGQGVQGYLGTQIVKGHRQIVSWHQLGSWIEQNTDITTYPEVRQAIFWFVAMEEADTLNDASQRDIAELFIDGIKPMDDGHVKDWVAIHYEEFLDQDDNLDVESAEINLLYKLNKHFNTESTSLSE